VTGALPSVRLLHIAALAAVMNFPGAISTALTRFASGAMGRVAAVFGAEEPGAKAKEAVGAPGIASKVEAM
ncbi:MAG: hypothetical protein ACOVLI_07970, partial [Rhabdaerophilum sp.]